MKKTLTRKPRQKAGMRTSTFDRNNLTQIISRAKTFLKESKPQIYAKSRRTLDEDVRRKCGANTIKHSSHVVETTRSMFSPYLLKEFRKCLLHHDWPGAKKLLLLFLKAQNTNKNQRFAWGSCLTALVHIPGTESILKAFININQGQFDSSDFLCGLLTINGLKDFIPREIESDEYSTDEEDEEDLDSSILSDEDDDDY